PGALSVNGGQVLLTSGGNKVLMTTDILVTGGKIDLNDNRAIVDYSGSSTIANVRALIQQGYNGGNWQGGGVTSSAAAATASSAHKTALGYAEASALGVGSFGGESFDGDAVLLRYPFAGDAN